MTDSDLELDISWEDISQWTNRYFHIVTLVALMVFMLYTRVQSYAQYLSQGQAYFSGNDAWYHYRQVSYITRHWPNTMPFDPWTGYPTGTAVGQFGTLYDQFVATIALLIGLGSPTQQTIGAVLVFAPAIVGMLVALPAYYIGTRLDSQGTGIFAAGILSFLPGTFFYRTLVGHSDHHGAEVLMIGIGLAALMYAINAVERDVFVLEIFQDAINKGDYETITPFLKHGAIAGIATALYMWVWPPGVLLVGIFAVFLALKASLDVLAEDTPEPTLLMGAWTMFVTSICMLIPLSTFSFSATQFSIAQVAIPFLTTLGAVFLIGLERLREKYTAPTYSYPLSIVTLGVIGGGLVSVVLPTVYGAIVQNIIRTVGLTTGAQTRTIAEAQPFITQLSQLVPSVMSEYGLMFFVAIVGVLVMAFALYKAYQTGEHKQTGEYTLFLVWFVVMLLAAFTQARYNYYFALAVSISAAYAFTTAIDLLNIPETFPKLRAYQYLSLALVLLVFVPTLIVPLQGTVVVAGSNDPGPTEFKNWENSLDWMEHNTPVEGAYGGSDNADQLDYYGEYPRQNDFQYMNGTYGVMSWWDYGHWITVESERIPVANPFQQHAQTAADYLLATNSTEAEQEVTQLAGPTENAPRYVAVDWKMVNPSSKLGAPAVFHNNISASDLYERVYVQNEQGQIQGTFVAFQQRYYESMMVKLYLYHGSAMQAQPIHINYNQQTFQTQSGESVTVNVAQNGSIFKTSRSQQEIESYAQNNSGQIGGIGVYPQEKVDALEHYRLVKASESQALSSRGYTQYLRQQAQGAQVSSKAFYNQPNWVKIFERVDGATVDGTGPVNTTVRASVEMQMPSSNDTFTYTQYAQTDADGDFTMTLPYSTTGYSNWGVEKGYTNVSVRANGQYTFSAIGFQNGSITQWQDKAHVTEGQVIGENETTVSVSLNPTNTTATQPQATTTTTQNETNTTNNTTTQKK